jgi:hypothetical protein
VSLNISLNVTVVAACVNILCIIMPKASNVLGPCFSSTLDQMSFIYLFPSLPVTDRQTDTLSVSTRCPGRILQYATCQLTQHSVSVEQIPKVKYYVARYKIQIIVRKHQVLLTVIVWVQRVTGDVLDGSINWWTYKI